MCETNINETMKKYYESVFIMILWWLKKLYNCHLPICFPLYFINRLNSEACFFELLMCEINKTKLCKQNIMGLFLKYDDDLIKNCSSWIKNSSLTTQFFCYCPQNFPSMRLVTPNNRNSKLKYMIQWKNIY